MAGLVADVIVVGHGLAGLVATHEIAAAGKTVLLIDQQGPQDFGGQAYWSFGGLFMVGTPEQRLCGIRDSRELAWQDWLGSAQFTDDDHWPRQWASSYVDFAAGEKRRWLRGLGWRAFRSPAGRNGAGAGRWAPATACPGSTSPGAPDPGWSRCSPAG
ncbi:hypothetical protein MMUR_27500 [Mycolicibacterium murale]|uniref:FAD-dependent oxidoreductase 2 FAD-binding domain-containing protein n=1 Tax=Mycolicibacterium murale TaxID=182220 RepID=A0A7I9WLR2_9MYCO|nr:hypothetical protein MMUR_27500 [Mycolicibacterium murale]